MATLSASPASAAVTVTVDALVVNNSAPVAARPMTATAKVHASGTLSVQALTIAVRDSAGQIVDFPGAIATTLTTAVKTFTTDARAYPAGTYTYFVAYQAGNVWTELTPRRTFTVAANPITFDQDFSGAAGAGPNTGLAARHGSTTPAGSRRAPAASPSTSWTTPSSTGRAISY
ncbi:MAG TPA: hypothetical protein VM347_43405 [Nonomuraea sp.]|nr:hypothetical protein [Nonomuraea sp.]